MMPLQGARRKFACNHRLSLSTQQARLLASQLSSTTLEATAPLLTTCAWGSTPSWSACTAAKRWTQPSKTFPRDATKTSPISELQHPARSKLGRRVFTSVGCIILPDMANVGHRISRGPFAVDYCPLTVCRWLRSNDSTQRCSRLPSRLRRIQRSRQSWSRKRGCTRVLRRCSTA